MAEAQTEDRAPATDQAGGGMVRDHPSPQCLTGEGWEKEKVLFPYYSEEWRQRAISICRYHTENVLT